MRNRFDTLGLSLLLTALAACESEGSPPQSINPALNLDASILPIDAALDAGTSAAQTASSSRIDELTVSGRSHHTAATTTLETPAVDATIGESASLTTVGAPSEDPTTTVALSLPSHPVPTVDDATEPVPDSSSANQTVTTTSTTAHTTFVSSPDASVESGGDAGVTLVDSSGGVSTSHHTTAETLLSESTDAAESDSSAQTTRGDHSATASLSSGAVESNTAPETASSSPTTQQLETTRLETTHVETTHVETGQSNSISVEDAATSSFGVELDADARDASEASAAPATWFEVDSGVPLDAALDASIVAPDASLIASEADAQLSDASPPTLDASATFPPPPGDAGSGECIDEAVRMTEEACGLNARGRLEQVCSGGAWVALACADPDVCVDQTSLTFACEGGAIGVESCVEGVWQDLTSCPTDCESNDTQAGSTACGYNQRGVLLQSCLAGDWVDTTTCLDPDECENDTSALSTVACGANGRGLRVQLCVAGRWTIAGRCEDLDVCTDGASEPTEGNCGLNSRGSLYRRCQTGQWTTPECDDLDTCTDTSQQLIGACGVNLRGRLIQTCALGQWSPHICLDTDVCLDSSERLSDEPCGLNSRGHLEQACADGQWQTTNVCAEVDVCVDASKRSGTTLCELDAGAGTLRQVCSNGAWIDTDECQPSELCDDSAARAGTSPCGLNGRGQVPQICVEGVWQDSSECQDPDTCVDETIEPSRVACGFNLRGHLSNVCDTGWWKLTETCVDSDVCVDGLSLPSTTACGLNGRGVFDQRCVGGVWVDGTNCTDPDECIDATSQLGTTACEGRGVLQQECNLGTWIDGSTCIKPRVARPNILLVISDDVGAEATSIYPNVAGTATPVATPTIESLAAQGLTFDNVWASPMCSPTRATVLSGKYGNRTGVTAAGLELPTTHETLHERIAAASPSYSMGVFGKWHLSGTNSNQDQANEVLHVLASGVPTFRGFMGAAVEDFFRWEAVDQAGTVSLIEQYSTTRITDWAIEYIQQRETETPDAPWFVYVPYNAAHDPYQVPPSNLHHVDVGGLAEAAAATSVPVYQAMLQALDTEFGRLLSVVNLEETVVIYMGDNGTPGEVKAAGSNVRGSKQGVYEGGVRVPLVISGANVTRVGEREDDLVVSSDLYATILTLTGVETPQIYDSFALNPLLETDSASSGRTHSFTELCNSTGSHYAVRNAQYKLLYEDRRFQLYDLWNDPRETRNLYTDTSVASVRSELETALSQIRAGSSAGCFR